MKLEELTAYEILEKREIADLNSMSYLMRHKKTGARLALLSNEDENKVFYIGFRTPPADSTGVPHILEHSVLEGSQDFPVKDPFIELAKGTLNTFLNAMTYPDKTIYPVASCNDKDFQNLMHVYLDAVFHPFIYKQKNIFLQEGWHYELKSEEDELTINGVVYNEMKGAFSSADDVLEREILNSLYPDTAYGYESGGDPDVIPSLRYEDFLNFHRRYYHPSNSYIYLYGNMDMAEKLDYIDKKYLSDFEFLPVDSVIEKQKPFNEMQVVTKEYPIGEEESVEENTYLSLNFSVGDSLDRELYIAFQILDYALCSAPGAPLKEALIHKGIGKGVYSAYENGICQPYFSVISKCAGADQQEAFLSTIEEVLAKLSQEGIGEKALTAGLNYYEFKYREADFGSYPKGLMYGLQVLDSWIYDDARPFIHIEANETFANLKKKIGSGYFEGLIRTMLLANPHRTLVRLIPRQGLTAVREQEQQDRLAQVKAQMSKEQLQEIIRETAELERWQEEEDRPEDLAKIPLLTREKKKKEANHFCNDLRQEEGTKVLFHPLFTNGIAYVRLVFDLKDIPEEDFAYMGLFKGVLGLLNTQNYSYGELFNEINIATGGMACVNNVYTQVEDPGQYKVTLELKTKVLYENLKQAFDLFYEIMFTSVFQDKKRLKEIISEARSRLQGQMMSAGHSVAVNRALSYFSPTAVLNEELSGITFFKRVEQWEENFEQESDRISTKLQQLARQIFRKENLMIDYAAEEKAYPLLLPCIRELKEKLYTGTVAKGQFEPVPVKRQEGFKSSSQVQYVAYAGNYRKKGFSYTGALKVLKVMMGYDYLWNQVRVKGGAYGCMCNFGKSGDCYFVSYRDPNLKNTLDIYREAPGYIAGFQADERTMTQFIIGAVSEMDMPMNPASKGLYSLSGYMTGVTEEMLQKERDEVLSADEKDLQHCAALLAAALEDDCLCTVGNAGEIEREKELFERVVPLFK